jgi:hydroxymethylglutaryl-CoA reductase (NADPH)
VATELALAFLSENALALAIATTVFAVSCGATRVFLSDSEESSSSASSPKMKGQKGKGGGGKLTKEPRPRWEVLGVLNYFVMALFVAALTYGIFNYRAMGRSDGGSGAGLFGILVVWCVCMAYFFGFFGISFLDKNAMVLSPSTFGLTELEVELTSSSDGNSPSRRSAGGSGGLCQTEVPSKSLPPKVAAASAAQDLTVLSDDELADCVLAGQVKDHTLESRLGDHARAVRVRRRVFESKLEDASALEGLPHEGYDYARIFGANCEIVCGYIPLPVGLVGPLLLDGAEVFVPMATTEGCLVASTNRGCKAITQAGGARSVILRDGITRAPCLRLPDAIRAAELKKWVEASQNLPQVRAAFESTTSFGKLLNVRATVAGRNVYLRLECFAGDAMGMNMVSKGSLAVVELLESHFPDMELIAISGNMCTDKKPAAVNWIEGRGKSVVCETRIPARYVETTLKTTVKAMVETNIQKNLVGSAMAGALGGFNAHASNVVTAVFLATGQDPAQNVESSTCITLMEEMDNGDLLVSVNMPSIEVGTVGGGTTLPAQAACLKVIGCAGAAKSPSQPGDNAQSLARVVAAAVLAGELSLVAALASNQLVRAHMIHNRRPKK